MRPHRVKGDQTKQPPPKKSKKTTPISTGPIGSINLQMLAQQKAADTMLQKKPKAKRKQLVPGRKRLKQNVNPAPAPIREKMIFSGLQVGAVSVGSILNHV